MGDKTFEISKELSTEEREKLNKYSDILAKLLFNRGLKTNEEADEFIKSDYDTGLHDPFLMKDLEKAVDRILLAIKKEEKICIFSDYDADGVPGAVVFSDFFKKIGYENVEVYIPHRNLEGFGLNDKAVKEISEKGTKLIVTIDCGIADLKKIDLANELGMEVIVTDHHEAAHGIPNAFAVVDPKREDCEYPYKGLCGSGVIFKVVQGLIKKGEFVNSQDDFQEGWEKWLLDMVGIATLSDMVPLTGENRVFAKYGLVVLQKSDRPGLQQLLKKGGTSQKYLTEEDVVFNVTPKINAASRMGHPDAAFKMLSTRDEAEAGSTVQYLYKINDERKGVVAGMVKEIKKYVEENLIEDGKLTVPLIVKGNPKWSPSLLGLAASSIVDTYNCPAFVWGRGEGDELKGSCRSDGSASVVSIMEAIPDGILETYGGHFMAGGFVLSMKGVDSLEEEMIKAYEKVSGDETNLFHKVVDSNLKIDDIDWKLFDDLKKLAPFGMNNNKPTFIFEDVILDRFETFGKQQNHGKFIFTKSNGSELQAIKFFVEDDKKIMALKPGDKITFTGHLEKSIFGGKLELRLRLIDLF
jgi:single-stranded-DNA-specific exonuclease